MGYLDAQASPAERTAFRKAEKRYKLYKQPSSSSRAAARSREKVPATDLSEVLDFRKISQTVTHGGSSSQGVAQIQEHYDWPVFTLEGHPGLYFIPGALSVEEQLHWIKESLTTFPEPPNRTNHTAFYGHINNLWSRAENHQVLVCADNNGNDSSLCSRDQISCEDKDNSTKFVAIGERTSGIGISGETDEDTTKESQRGMCIASTVAFENSAGCFRHDEKTSLTEGVDSRKDVVQVTGRCNVTDDHASNGRKWNDSSCCRFVDKEHFKYLDSTSLPKLVPAKTLLRKLRWATVGLQFDWSKRAYDTSLPHREIPSKLSELACKLAKPAMMCGCFHAEAAIVNFFGCDDMLGGHLDDMEADWSKPIVSISLGCKAIFLLGGPSREDPPVAMFLRSGDVLLMAGHARSCFHGVPRIFVEPQESDLPDFGISGPFVNYIKDSRININIRQVY